MYINILKRDLKRKKTMNIILSIFIILSVMFVSSSVNNLLAVTNALDSYFNMAGLSDYVIATKGTAPEGYNVEDIVKNLDCIDSYKEEDVLYISQANIKKDGKNLSIANTPVFTALENAKTNFFDNNGNQITKINDNEIYLLKSVMDSSNISVGDKITIINGNKSKDFTVKGNVKDALLGSAMMGSPRFLINKNDYDFLASDKSSAFGKLININTNNIFDLEQEITKCPNIVFSETKSRIKSTYIMDMIVAGVLLIVSIFLIIIAFVILRFTIAFTLSEEYKEIGIMKAIGISNKKIRGLYIVKYLAISIFGAIFGFIFGIPFGNMMLKQASENIIIVANNEYLISIACSLTVVLIIILFCYSCTRKVNKLSPVAAIRNGGNGERYKKKGILSLSKSKCKPIPFIALNDILSQAKHFIVMFIAFTIGILLITIVINTINTLKSDKLINWFSMSESDLFIEDKDIDRFIVNGGEKLIEEEVSRIKSTLKENGIEAQCFWESIFRFTVSKGDISCKSLCFKGTGSTTDQYMYIEGTAPQNANEIAITYIIADKINANIGDTVTITTMQENKEYIVTAIYQSMNNMGEGVRFHQDEKISIEQAMGLFSYQIKYLDNPTKKIKEERIALIKECFPEYTVRTGGEYIGYMLGGIDKYMSSIKILVSVIVIIINILVAVLMEKSFLIKEKGEIAILKAMGFRNNSIILWQTLRIAILSILSTLAALCLSNPIGQLSSGAIFRMMGAYNIIFDINVLESYIIYPLIVSATTIFAVFVVSQQARKVLSSEINNIE